MSNKNDIKYKKSIKYIIFRRIRFLLALPIYTISFSLLCLHVIFSTIGMILEDISYFLQRFGESIEYLKLFVKWSNMVFYKDNYDKLTVEERSTFDKL